jgi:gliding motility-associated-like protein
MTKFSTILVAVFYLLFFNVKAQNQPLKFSGYIGHNSAEKPKNKFLQISDVSHQQIAQECSFFGGDTLSGFDLEKNIKDIEKQEHVTSYGELIAFMQLKQSDFVKNKYNLAKTRFHKQNQINYKNMPPATMASSCSNLDFENGNMGSWSYYEGYNTNSNGNITNSYTGTPPVSGPDYNTNGGHSDCQWYELINSSYGSDYYGGFPGLYSGAGYSARLGSDECNLSYYYSTCALNTSNTYSGAEALAQSFKVTSSNALLSYNYAIVLNDGGHTNGNQPYFHVLVLDSAGNLLSTCHQYYVQVASGVVPPGFSTSGNSAPEAPGSAVYYLPWTSNSVNLSAYMNHTIQVWFISAGCTAGQHFGYAYVDATCGAAQITANPVNPCPGVNTVLTAPAAANGTYAWSGPGIVGSTTGQSISVNASGTYTVDVTPSQGVTCKYSLTQTVTYTTNPTVTVNSPTVCSGSSVNLTASGASTYVWNTGSTANPLSITSGATSYTVTGTSAAGCTNTAVSTVTVVAKPTVTVNSPTVCSGSSVNLTAAGANTYTWNTGSTSNPLSVSPGATSYTVIGTAATSCTNSAVSTVTVVAKPTVTVNSPTVCSGSSVNLTAAGASTYTWNTGSTSNPLSVSPGATSYTVIGTAATSCTNSAVSTVTVVAKPTVTVNSPTICNGVAAVLTSSGASTYTWSTAATTSTISVSPGATTNYTVNGTSVAGCTNTATSTVTVNALPTVTVNSPTICNGVAAVLTGSGATTYTWSTAATTSTISVSPATTTNYTVTGSSGVGCTNTATSTVTVNPKPTYSLTASSYTVCNGSSQTFTVSGASTYTWTPAATLTGPNTTNPTASPTTTTVYSVIGTSALGCGNATPATVTLTINPKPTYTLTGNAYTICNGGSQTFTVSGASTYTWTPTATLTNPNTANPTASPTATTVYNVTGTSALGCGNATPATVTVNVTAVPVLSLAGNSYTICNGSSQTFSVNGTSTYTWTPAATLNNPSIANPIANPTTTTIYTVSGTASGCAPSSQLTLTLTVNPLPTYSLAANSYTICEGNTQAITVSGANTYTWTPAATLNNPNIVSPTASPTTTTVYSVTGTSTLSCTNLTPATVTVNVNPKPTYSLTGNNYTICNGGSQTFTVSGANTYTWTPAATLTNANTANPTASPTAITVYSVTGTSALGCGNASAATVTVDVTPIPSLSLTANSYTICNGGSQTFSVSGANTYTWTPPATLSNANIANPTANPTNTVVYTVGGTASGCANSTPLTLTLTVNQLPTYSLSASSYTICNGGSQAFSVSGASSYTWTPAATLSNPNIANPTANPTTTTVYNVTGTSSSACTNLIPATVTLTVNPLPTYSLAANSYSICSGASQTFSVSGISSTYTWTPAGTLTNANTATPTANPTTTTVYSVTGTSANACTNLVPGTVTVNVTATPTMAISGNLIICFGDSTTLTALSAANYTWMPGGITTSTITVKPTTNATYTVTGANGTCTTNAVATVTANPLPLITIVPTSTAICSDGGSSTLTASGANTYTWSPAATLSTPTGSMVTAIPTDTTTPTDYTITATDANSCVNTNTISITVNPTPTVTTAGGGSNSQVVCGGGLVNTNVNGITFSVTPSGSVSWTNDNTAIGLVAAGSGTNIATYPAPTVTAQTTGVITVNASASSGCASTSNTQLIYTVTINPIPSVITPTINSAGCGLSDGTIIGASGTGSSGNYSYSWNGGSFTADSSLIDSAGTYPLQIKDNVTGCISNQNFTIPNVGAPAPPTVTPSATAACVGGTIVLTVPTSTLSGVTYNWTEANGNNGTGNTYTVTNMPSSPNPYTIDVTATASNCKGAAGTTSITVNPLPHPFINSTTSQICQGSSTTLSVTPTGAYTYQWGNSSGIIVGATSDTLSVSSSDTYSVTITNSNNCSSSTSVNGVITVNSLPSINTTSVIVTQSSCNGSSGSITNAVIGGAATITYTWTNGTATGAIVGTGTGTSASLSNVSAGAYCLNVTDGNTCQNSFCSVTITNSGAPVQPNLTALVNDTVYCNGTAPQTLTVSVTSTGTITPSVTWYADATLTNTLAINTNTYTPSASLPIGTTTVYVTATANGCASISQPVTITILPTPTISIAPLGSNSVICNGASVVITPTGATTYTLNPGNQTGTSFTVSPNAVGITTYTIDGSNGTTSCTNALSNQETASITVNATPTITIAPLGSNSVICNGASVVITPTGATTYTLNPGNQTGTSFTVSPSTNTTYTINGNDGTTGCANASSDTGLASITVSSTPTISIVPLGSNSVICNGSSVIITPQGATSYTLNPGNQVSSTNFIVSPTTGTTTYTLDGTDGTTTCANVAAGQSIFSINVNATPTVSIGSVSSNSICSGASTVITPAGATTYTLNPGNQIGTSFTVSPTSSTTYTINGNDGSTSCINASSDAGLTNITVNQTPTVNVSGISLDSAKCGQATGGVNGITIVGGAPNYTYQWYDANGAITGATSLTLSNVATGNYSLQVTDANGCMANGAGGVTTFSVPASTAVHAQFSTNPSLPTGTVPLAIIFNNTSNGASNYIWSFGDAANTYTTSTNANFTYTSIGTYTATLVAINGACSDTARVVIVAEIPTSIIIPNIFSPNGDGVNDEFFIINTGMSSMNCDIFNRWGQLLYTLTAPDQSWDGKLINGDKAPEGTYMYILEAHGLDNKVYKQQGTVTLVR